MGAASGTRVWTVGVFEAQRSEQEDKYKSEQTFQYKRDRRSARTILIIVWKPKIVLRSLTGDGYSFADYNLLLQEVAQP